jgi:hypothetical protein
VVKKHAVKWIVPVLKYGVGFGLLALIIFKYWDADPAKDRPKGVKDLLEGTINYEWFAVAGLLIAVALSLQLYRWYLLVRALDLPTTVRNAYRLGLVGVYYNTFFPGSVGGDLLKAYFIAKAHPERKAAAISTVLIDRAMGLFGLIFFVAVTGTIAWQFGDPRIQANAQLQWIVKLMAGISITTVSIFLALGLLPQRRVDRFAGRLKAIPKLGKSLAEVWYAVWTYRQRMKVVVVGLVLSALSHFCLVFAFHSASRVFPPDNPEKDLPTIVEHMVIAPIGFIAQAVPLTPGGVGVGEGVFVWLYDLSDRSKLQGFVARLSLRIAEWSIGLIGYLVYLRMRAEVREVQHEVEEEQGV